MNSVIHPSVKIADTARVGNFVTIEEGCVIGEGCFIGNNCVLRPFTYIGNRTVVGHGTVFEGSCRIGEDCLIHAQVHITRGVIIEDKVFIAPMTCLANDKHMAHMRGNWIPQPPIIRRGARIGIGCSILPGVEIGANSVIGAGAVIAKNVPEGKMVLGVPGKIIGDVPRGEWV